MIKDAFLAWYADNCRELIAAEDEIKNLMRKAFEAGQLDAGPCRCTCSNCSGCLA